MGYSRKKKIITFLTICCFLLSTGISAKQVANTKSPDGQLKLNVSVENGSPVYSVSYQGEEILENSPLGLITNEGDFHSNMSFVESSTEKIKKEYVQAKIKHSFVKYEANTLKCTFSNAEDKPISVLFQVSNNNIAFRYELPKWGDTRVCVVEKEATGYRFPDNTKSFLSPMMCPM